MLFGGHYVWNLPMFVRHELWISIRMSAIKNIFMFYLTWRETSTCEDYFWVLGSVARVLGDCHKWAMRVSFECSRVPWSAVGMLSECHGKVARAVLYAWGCCQSGNITGCSCVTANREMDDDASLFNILLTVSTPWNKTQICLRNSSRNAPSFNFFW